MALLPAGAPACPLPGAPACPLPGAPACMVCNGPAHSGFALCYCCDTLVRQLRMPLAPVEVLADYRTGDHMHRRLRGYKDATAPGARHAHAKALAALLDRWMAANRDGLLRRFGSGWDLVAAVPSTHRPVGAPADALIALVPELARCHRVLLGRGPEATGHLHAARRGFVLTPAVDPAWLKRRRILVFDDTITTGARAQSAVAALRIAGARVVGVVAVGRARGAVDRLRSPHALRVGGRPTLG